MDGDEEASDNAGRRAAGHSTVPQARSPATRSSRAPPAAALVLRVVSRTLQDAGWENSRIARDLESEVKALRDAPGRDILVINSAA